MRPVCVPKYLRSGRGCWQDTQEFVYFQEEDKMGKVQEKIAILADKLPEKYQEAVLDFIEFLISRVEWENDTEYLNSIPGMAQKIIDASKMPIESCDTTLDW